MYRSELLGLFNLIATCLLKNSAGRALHRHRRGHGFESRSSLNFFRLSIHNCSSCVNNYDGLSSIEFFILNSQLPGLIAENDFEYSTYLSATFQTTT